MTPTSYTAFRDRDRGRRGEREQHEQRLSKHVDHPVRTRSDETVIAAAADAIAAFTGARDRAADL